MTDEQHAYRAQTCRHRVTTRVSGTRDLWRCSWCNTLLQDNVTVIDPDAGEALIEQVAEDGTTSIIAIEIDTDPEPSTGLWLLGLPCPGCGADRPHDLKCCNVCEHRRQATPEEALVAALKGLAPEVALDAMVRALARLWSIP